MLTFQQNKVVEHNYKPSTTLVVKAGPGTGKTYTLTQRINRIVRDGVKPEEILVLSFTNKTVNLLNKVIDENITVKTFHSYASKIVEKYYKEYLPDRVELKLLDDVSWASLKRLFGFRNSFDNAVKDVRSGLSIQDVANKYKINHGRLKNVMNYLTENGLVRYSDFISTAIEILQVSDDIAEVDNLKVIVVDEYQDLYPEIIDFIDAILLYGKPKHLTFAGDPNQNIYEFLGSSSHSINQFLKRWGKYDTIYLNESFRLTPENVDYVNKIHPAEIISMKESLSTPVFFSGYEFMVKEIEKLILESGGMLTFQDFLILARSNSQVEEVGKVLQRYSLPVSLKSDPQWLKSRIYIFLDILNVLKGGHGSDFALLSVLMKIGYPRAKLNRIFKSKNYKDTSIRQFITMLQEERNLSSPIDILLSLSRITNRVQPLREYINQDTGENITSFYNSLNRSYKQASEEFVNHFLSNYVNDYEECNAINISTIHKSKGLEYPIVFLLNQNIEKNLKFVASTRAQSLLYIQGEYSCVIQENIIQKVAKDLGRRLNLNNVILGRNLLKKLC